MQQYIMRRILLAIPTLIGVSILIFLVMRVLPGDPLQAMVDEEGGPTSYTEEQKQVILTSLGLDRPLYPESTEGGPWGQPLKKREGAPMNLG